MDYSIRPVREDDAELIADLLNRLIQEGIHTIMDEPISLADQIAYIRAYPKRGVFHVAVREGHPAILGIQDLEPFSASASAFRHVGNISTFVAPDAHRMGIGRSLSHATFQAAKALGFQKICATIRADNPQAVSFYLSQGFRVIGTAQRHALVRGRYLDELLTEKFIPTV